jgi:hypothetical protein
MEEGFTGSLIEAEPLLAGPPSRLAACRVQASCTRNFQEEITLAENTAFIYKTSEHQNRIAVPILGLEEEEQEEEEEESK